MQIMNLAGCVIPNAAGEVLLLHRNTEELQQYELPGGKQKPGEDLEDTARREIFEELGVSVKILGRLGCQTFSQQGRDWNYNWFLAEIENSQTPTIKEPDIFDGLAYINLALACKGSVVSPNLRNLNAAFPLLAVEKLKTKVIN